MTNFKISPCPQTIKTCFHCPRPLIDGQRKNCSDCTKKLRAKRNRIWHATHKENRRQRSEKNHKSPSYRWHLLKQNAKRRNLIVSMTREEFEILSKNPCYYCQGKLDVDTGWGTHIDRLDNKVGYEFKNSVSCCDFCNRIKQDLLTPEETIAVIKIIIQLRDK